MNIVAVGLKLRGEVVDSSIRQKILKCSHISQQSPHPPNHHISFLNHYKLLATIYSKILTTHHIHPIYITSFCKEIAVQHKKTITSGQTVTDFRMTSLSATPIENTKFQYISVFTLFIGIVHL